MDIRDEYSNKAFANNCSHILAVEKMRHCLLVLSSKGVDVVRMQSRDEKVLIEVKGPVVVEGSTETQRDGKVYHTVEISGCQVFWHMEK